MKVEQSKVHREIELAYLNLVPMSARMPAIPMLKAVSDRMANEFLDALSATALALNTASLRDRLSLLELVELHLQNVDTAVRMLYEWSSMRGQTGQLSKGDQPGTEPENAKPMVRIISKRQYARYLAAMHSIYRQIGAWRKSTEKKLQNEDQSGNAAHTSEQESQSFL